MAAISSTSVPLAARPQAGPRDRWLYLVVGAAFALWALSAWRDLAGARIVAGTLLVYLVPGLALLRLVRSPRLPMLPRVLLAATISPIVLGLAGMLGAAVGRTLPQSGLAALMLCGAIVLWPSLRLRAGEPPASGDDGRPDRVVIVLGLLAGGLVALGYLNPWVRNWSDAWAHAALYEEVVRSGFPPMFAHFPGFPIPYAWFFYVFLGAAGGVIDRDPLVLLATLNVVAALLFPIAACELARAMGSSRRAARWAALAALVAMNPLGPAWLLVKAFHRPELGWARWNAYVGSTNDVMGALEIHFPFFQSSLFARFWTPSAFNFALLLFAAVMQAMLAFWERPGVRRALTIAALIAGLLLWHSLTALQATAALAAGGLVALVLAHRGERTGITQRDAGLALAVVAAYLLASPYLRSATAGAGAGELLRLRLSTLNLAGLVLSMGPLLIAGAIGWMGLEARRRAIVGGALLGLLGVFLLVDTAGGSEEKFYLPLYLAIAALAGQGLTVMWGRRGWLRVAVAALVIGGVANAGLTAWAFTHDHRPIRELFARVRPGDPAFLTVDEEAALRWIRERAPCEAVFVQCPRPNGPEPILVLGRRRIFLGMAESFYDQAFFGRGPHASLPEPIEHELRRREGLLSAAFSDRALAPDSLAALRAYPWPMMVWWDVALGDGRLSPSLRPGNGVTREVFDSPTVRLLEIRPAP